MSRRTTWPDVTEDNLGGSDVTEDNLGGSDVTEDNLAGSVVTEDNLDAGTAKPAGPVTFARWEKPPASVDTKNASIERYAIPIPLWCGRS